MLTVATVFAVVGEHEENPDRLLLLGDDGRYYQYDLSTEATAPVEPEVGWVVDYELPTLEEMNG